MSLAPAVFYVPPREQPLVVPPASREFTVAVINRVFTVPPRK